MPSPDVSTDQLRHRVRADVAAREPVDEREAASVSKFLELYDALDSPFDIDADPVHVTASGIVVGPRGVLLHEHKRLGIWIQPGGHVDPGETPWEGALRETHEETGLRGAFAGPFCDDGTPVLVHLDVHAGGRGHTHLDLRYLIDGGDADPDPPEGESQAIDWFDWPAAIEITDLGLRGALLALRPTDELES
ncbi:MAG: NUDIX domain-containing protein [Acidimicrobiia bacterium]|nr:NUDIX domain-containing protein [Acidimicrobiia bacterium]